jgi:cytosine/adenosine deaminase-related metal-dependent hydrolase
MVPIAGPAIAGGWVAVDHGRITDVGGCEHDRAAIDLGSVAILPALVNAHTHLELSYLRGRVPPAQRFPDWIRAVMRIRREHPDAGDSRILAAASTALEEARSTGTGLVGDISNTLVTVPLLDAADVPAHVFYELIGFAEPDPAGRVGSAREQIDRLDLRTPDVRISLAAHAPYSVSPSLLAAIRADLEAHAPRLSSVHVAESAAEVELLARGTGEWKTLLQELGVWTDRWQVPGASPVAYLDALGFLDGSVLAVHGVQLDDADLSRLRALGTTVVSCPRSNRHVGVGSPPLDAFYASGVSVAFGTDSLASAPDLNLFSELAEARRVAPRVPAARLLESATLSGARALGFGDDLGSIEAGKRAALIAVRVPEAVSDVEEYLVSGIDPTAVAWLDRGVPPLHVRATIAHL